MGFKIKYGYLKIALIISVFHLNNCAAFSAEMDSVAIINNNETNIWNATFYKSDGTSFKTIEIDTNIIAAINTILIEASEDAHIDVLSSGTFIVNTEDALGGIAPLNGQTIDFHNNEIKIINPFNLRMNGINATRKHGVTIKNFRLSGNVTYGIWTKGCDNLTIDNLDIDLDKDRGLAVFIRPRGDYRPRNLTIKGDIYINGGKGHAIEFTSVDTVDIGDVTVSNNIAGCGINASGSTHIKIGNVYGYKNCYNLEGEGGGYATLRYSNAGQYLECNGIYSRRCGRGYMITQGDNSALPGVLGQHFSTVEVVDIKHTVKQNIFIRGTLPTNNHVLSGTASASLYQPENLIYLEGETNTVSLGIPDITVDTNSIKTARINELRFGFYDLTGDEYSENYIRDRNCDGFGYAKTVDKIGAFMEWSVISGNGNHVFNWRYACALSKKAKLLLNGKYICTIEFPGTGSDSIWQTNSTKIQKINASEIKNIKLIAIDNNGLPLIDYFEVQAPGVTCSLKDVSTATDSMNVIVDNALNIENKVSKKNNIVNIYPNPNDGIFTIEINDILETPYKVQVFDLSGSLVQYSNTLNGNRLHVKLTQNHKGLYLVKVSSKNDMTIFKINCL